MKKNLLSSLALIAAAVACMSTSWGQSVTQKPADSAKSTATAKVGPAKVAAAAEVDRKKKAAETMSNMQKKTDETAKSVTGNIK